MDGSMTGGSAMVTEPEEIVLDAHGMVRRGRRDIVSSVEPTNALPYE